MVFCGRQVWPSGVAVAMVSPQTRLYLGLLGERSRCLSGVLAVNLDTAVTYRPLLLLLF